MKMRKMALLLALVLVVNVFFVSPIFVNASATSANANGADQQSALSPTYIFARTAPPANFDPIKATKDDLKKYGFPDRPTDPKDLARWTSVMSHAKYYFVPELIKGNIRRGLIGTNNPYTWGGYHVPGANNGGAAYYGSYAEWVQPTFSGNGDPSFWTGVGGATGSDTVFQAGCDSGANNTNANVPQYCFWVELYPYPQYYICSTRSASYPYSPASQNLSPRGGDTVYSQVIYNTSNPSDSSVFLEDVTTGAYTTVTVQVNWQTLQQTFGSEYPGHTFSYQNDLNSADYVLENTNNLWSGWTSWGSTSFWDCGCYPSNSSNGYFNQYNYYMDVLGNNAATPSSVETINGFPGFTITANPV